MKVTTLFVHMVRKHSDTNIIIRLTKRTRYSDNCVIPVSLLSATGDSIENIGLISDRSYFNDILFAQGKLENHVIYRLCLP